MVGVPGNQINEASRKSQSQTGAPRAQPVEGKVAVPC